MIFLGLTPAESKDAVKAVRNPASTDDPEQYIAEGVAISKLCIRWKKTERVVIDILTGMVLILLLYVVPNFGDDHVDMRRNPTSRTARSARRMRDTDYV